MNAPAVRGQAEQVERIKAVREAADAAGVPMVINARTDLLLKDPDIANHALLFDEIVERAAAYAEAGADCLFVPALHNDLALVARIIMRGCAPSGQAELLPALGSPLPCPPPRFCIEKRHDCTRAISGFS